MEKILKNLIICTLFLLVISPHQTSALSGLSERDSEYYYNENLIIELSNPSDTCPKGYGDQYCLAFKDVQGYIHVPLLTVVSNPLGDYIAGKTFEDKKWILYDTKKDKILLATESENELRAKIESLDMYEVQFYSLEKVHKFFQKTSETRKDDRNEMVSTIVFWAVIILILSTIVGTLKGYSVKDLSSRKKIKDLIKSICTLLVIFMIIYTIIISIAFYNLI